jgi:hypothetical protein
MMRNPGARATVLALLMLVGWPAGSQDQGPSEYQVKAAFLYNFIKFVEWPVFPGRQTVALCVLGNDPFDGELARAVDGKNLDGRPLTIRRISDAKAAQSCHVLFVSGSEAGRASEIVKIVGSWSVLTVSDSEQLWAHGVMIDFLMDGQKVRFRINRVAAERASLKISSKLLQLSLVPVDK